MDWKELHYKSNVVDLHTHAAMKALLFDRGISGRKKGWFRELFKKSFWPFSERVTFKQSQQGGLDVMLSTLYAVESGWAKDMSLINWLIWLVPRVRRELFDLTYFDGTINMMNRMEREIDSYNKDLKEGERAAELVTSSKRLYDLVKAPMLLDGDEERPMAVIHAVEGGHSLHGPLGCKEVGDCVASEKDLREEIMTNLETLYDRGVAYLTLAHFFPNHIANPVFPYPEYALKHVNRDKVLNRWDMNKGLTEIGKEVVEKMLDMGMIIDVCHCTPKARKQVYDIVDASRKRECLMSTHTGVFEINPDPYNLEDWELKWMGKRGCVAGCIFMNYWLSPIDSGLGLKHIERTLNHMRNAGGADLPAIGSDFDGFTDPPDELVDVSELPRLTKYLMASQHFSDEELVKILGGNAMRVLLNGWN